MPEEEEIDISEEKRSEEASDDIEEFLDQPLEILEESFIPDLRNTFQPVNPGLEELEPSENLERRTIRFIDEEQPEEQPQEGIYDLTKLGNPESTSMPYDTAGAASSYDINPAGQDAYSAAPQDFNQQPTGFGETEAERKIKEEKEERRLWGG
jgi:hypothetical protein